MLLTLRRLLPARFGPTFTAPSRPRAQRKRQALGGKLFLEALEDRCLLSGGLSAPLADSLYVGDGLDNTVKRFDATTGAYQGAFVTSGSGGLLGPRGLIFGRHGDLVVVNQNVSTTINGEVFRYDGHTGDFLNKIVATTDAHAPFQPRGILQGPHHTLFVADLGNLDGIIPGRLPQYDDTTGAWKRDLTPTGFTGEFNPRGLVIGPDGALYVSVRNVAATGGHIVKFSPGNGKFIGDFIDSNPTNDLNRPEGIAFGPDGNLYVASFRANSSDTDKILEFNGTTGAYLGKIDEDQVGQPRAFGQALLFGPGGKLFVPITGLGTDTGEVRRYDVGSGTFDVFVPSLASGGPLGMPWYLTFGQTDSQTLAYVDQRGGAAALSSLQAVNLHGVSALATSVAGAGTLSNAPQTASGDTVAALAPTSNNPSPTSATAGALSDSDPPLRHERTRHATNSGLNKDSLADRVWQRSVDLLDQLFAGM